MADLPDKAREEFFSEAQEIIESLAKSLLALDAAMKRGAPDPTLVNEAFRAVHTLKGLAGLFGAAKIGAISHRLEDLLDALRLGRTPLTPELLDVLFRAVDGYAKVLQAERAGTDDAMPAVDALLGDLDRVGSMGGAPPSPAIDYDLDPGMLAVLTEYEEHRLSTNIAGGLRLYRLRVQFDLATIDKALDEIKDVAKAHGEIITYLPTGEATSADSIELDLLMASHDDHATLIGSLGADNVVIEAIPRRGASRMPGRLTVPPGASDHGPLSMLGMDDLAGIDDAHREASTSLRSVAQTVRVDIRKLDHLMNIVGELAIVRSAFAAIAERVSDEASRQLATQINRLHRTFDRRLTELQDGILEVRMVPLGQIFDRLARVVRQISREAGKDIRLVITGAETEIDKLIVEELSDPLMHMIRNAIDHGIETAASRKTVGKPESGTIALNAFQKGNHVVLEIEDDGAGIDDEALVLQAVASGKLGRDDVKGLSRDEMLALIFLPGVSTRERADELSGRGVGMDVVKTNISKLGGIIDVQSERGIGTKMTITLPITLAIVSAILMRVGQQIFGIPLNAVSEAIAFDGSGTRMIEHREVMTLRGETLPLCRLRGIFAIGEATERGRGFVVVTTLGSRRVGLVVDSLLGQQDIVIKALGPSLASVRGFAGATELGDQTVCLVLDTGSLIEEVLEGNGKRKGEVGASA